ncbi:MAG: O-antigen ligase family protein [Anaerolineae bacterium]|nr:O-antigen ligase family protein [Anaerolineae bacterium]
MPSSAAQAFKEWVMTIDRRIFAIMVGLTIGILGGIIGLLLVTIGPVLTIPIIIGVLVALYVLTDVTVALYGAMATMILLPFGTFPVKIGLTPTLLDLALGAFIGVYLLQWMTGHRRKITLSPPHALIALYLMWLIFAFSMGMRYGSPRPTVLRQFAETLLSIGMTFILVDLLQDEKALRRLVLVIMALVGIQAFIAIGLYALPDGIAERFLIRLGRIGYPTGGVIRYIESTPALGERAIGTWVDPNSLGGLLAVGGAMIAPQVFAQKPVLKTRWLTFLVFGLVTLGVILTSSRASFLAFAAGLAVITIVRYRRIIPLLGVAGIIFLFLPQTQNYIDRIFQAFRGEDLATQMRIGEWTDSLNLIQQYPFVGIGFTGTPTNDVYTDVANMYLIMANQIGLTGVLFFLLAMGGIFAYGYRAWQHVKDEPNMAAIHLGYQVAVLTALINAFADLYFFRLDFQASITWFWLIVALAIASSRLILQQASESTIAVSSAIK